MLTFTNAAREVIVTLATQMEGAALRIVCGGSALAPEYELSLVDAKQPGDLAVDQGEFKVYIEADSLQRVQGRTVDWVDGPEGTGFVVRQPEPVRHEGAVPAGELAKRIVEVLETQINPAVASHGGHIGLVDVKGTTVYIEMSGGCQGCGMARVTLRQGVERMLRHAVPEIGDIVDVTDHASGVNPYYSQPA